MFSPSNEGASLRREHLQLNSDGVEFDSFPPLAARPWSAHGGELIQ